ncbi:MAG: hypothetical protein ACPGJS_06430 [Flammeovirgaceae bacterium]
MKINKSRLLVVFMIVGLTSLTVIAQAQLISIGAPSIRKANPNPWSLGIQAMFATPVQELKHNHYRNGGGIALEVFSPSLLPSSNLLNIKLGTHLDYMRSGTEMEMLDLRAYGTEPVEYRARNQSAGFHLIGRLTTKEMGVTPYLDGIIGSRWLFSTSSVLIEEEPDCPHYETDFLTNTLTFVYGGAVGAMVRLDQSIMLDFRMTYSQGSAANFINLDNFDEDINGQPIVISHRDADEAEATTTTTYTAPSGSNPEHTILKRIRTPQLFFSAGLVFKL